MWYYLASYLGDQYQIYIGHNLKTAWVLLRLYQLTGDEKYLNVEKIYQPIYSKLPGTASIMGGTLRKMFINPSEMTKKGSNAGGPRPKAVLCC